MECKSSIIYHKNRVKNGRQEAENNILLLFVWEIMGEDGQRFYMEQ